MSWRKQHRYLTLVTDHRRRQVVWGCQGAGSDAADEFFADLDPSAAADADPDAAGPENAQPELDPAAEPQIGERAAKLEAISMDMGPGYAKSARKHAPQAVICIDTYHVIALANKALDEVRRSYWNELRQLGDQDSAKDFKQARWSLLKNPEDLTQRQAQILAALQADGGAVARAYTLKEALRAILTPGLSPAEVAALLTRFCSHASRSRLGPFVRLGRTIRKHRPGTLAAIRLKINKGDSCPGSLAGGRPRPSPVLVVEGGRCERSSLAGRDAGETPARMPVSTAPARRTAAALCWFELGRLDHIDAERAKKFPTRG